MRNLCSIESFYSNMASASIRNPFHRIDSYGHIRQLRSFLNSYDHFLTVTIIAPEQLRSYRRCRVCKLRSYCESFTSPYLGNQCTNQQNMARKIETDDAPLLCTDTRVQSCVQVSQSGRDRTHRRRRPPSCMIVTAMIVTVSPQWNG